MLRSYADAARMPSSLEEQFDRVVCDAPCSGDATLRKNADKWRRWHTGMGPSHHPQQLRILLRGLGARVGGGFAWVCLCDGWFRRLAVPPSVVPFQDLG